jgi:hypothetical protein
MPADRSDSATCTSLAAGAHRSCQGWPSHQPFPTSSAVARPHLDRFELVSGGSKDPNHDAVMASAAKLRGGGPILHFGIGSQGNTSGPRHLEPSSAIPSQADGPGRNCWVSFSDLCSLCRAQDDAVRHHALPHAVAEHEREMISKNMGCPSRGNACTEF